MMRHRGIEGSPSVGATPPERRAGTGLVIWSQLFLRTASSAGVLVVGGYIVYLRDQGDAVNSVLLGGVSALFYVAELLWAPLAGSLSDQRGRKLFLLAGPALSAAAVLLIPLGAATMAVLPVGIVVGLVGLARLVEGVGAAVSVPATLSFLAESTDGQPVMRGRSMSFFELASSIGIAAGAVVTCSMRTLAAAAQSSDDTDLQMNFGYLLESTRAPGPSSSRSSRWTRGSSRPGGSQCPHPRQNGWPAGSA